MGRSRDANNPTVRSSEISGSVVDPEVTLRGEETGWSDPSSDVVDRLTNRARPFDRYTIRSEVARGGQGAVLEVWDEDLRRSLAMKVIAGPGGPESTSLTGSKGLVRFLEEAQVTGQLDHPGILPIHELGLDDAGRVYFTMKLVRGRELSKIFELVGEGREEWTVMRALGVILKVCEATAYAHYKGVVHRDLKPANVMVGRFGAVYVMDWGIARVLDRKDDKDIRIRSPARTETMRSDRRDIGRESPDSPLLTMDGDVMGTPAYMSPEQAKGQLESVGPQTDVYAIGAMLYHLLTGQMPYVPADGVVNSYAIWSRVQEGPPRPLHELATDVPAELAAICEKAMSPDLAVRYESMDALSRDIRAFLEDRVVHAYEAGAWAEAKKWVRRNKPLAASLAAAVTVTLGGLGAVGFVQAEGRRAAEEQRAIAEANKERAVASEVEAKEQARIATKRAEDVLRLSALQELDDLRVEAEELWPPHPDRVVAFEAWLSRAEDLVKDLPNHEAKREEIRSRALPRTAEERERDRDEHPLSDELDQARSSLLASLERFDVALAASDATALDELEAQIASDEARVRALEDEVSRPWRWSFEETEDRWWHAQLSKLIDGLEALADEETGLISGTTEEYGWSIERRLDFAKRLAAGFEDGAEYSRAWRDALPEIEAAYPGLDLAPQDGLVPIGPDPESGLWEFAHLMTGEPVQRDRKGRLILSEEGGLVLVLLPGGSFWMGAQSHDPSGRNYDPAAQGNEGPVHEVVLSPFFLSKYEMTQGQWLRLTGSNPSSLQQSSQAPTLLHPVEQVTWHDCRTWLARAGLALPTEAQWESGARAGKASPWWTGTEWESLAEKHAANVADEAAARAGATFMGIGQVSEFDDGYAAHAPVGTYAANPFGLHDVAGNLWEWCLDGYEAGFYGRSPRVDPVRSFDNAVQGVVNRGGGFHTPALHARSAIRLAAVPSVAIGLVGVRPARAIGD